jgi:AcrR family transcriptional regulator
MGSGKPRKAGRPRNPISRDALLSVARAVFAESGYAGASMNEIAHRAGIRKASLFHHFASKEALYLEIVANIANDLARLIIEADFGDGGFAERLDQLGSLVTRYLGQETHVARLAMRELVDGGPFSQGAGRKQVEVALQAVSGLLLSGMTTGAIPHQDPRQLAVSITGLHLFHFAAANTTADLFDGALFTPDAVAQRAAAVRSQVRRLCGLEPAAAAEDAS